MSIRRILLRIGMLGAICLLPGCTLLASPQVRNEAVNKYGPVEPHWIGGPRRIDSLLYLGFVDDPASHEGRLVPDTTDENPKPAWYTSLGLDQIEVYVDPRTPRSQAVSFGPREGDPKGIYKYELRTEGDPACGPFNAAREAFRVSAETTHVPESYWRLAPASRCIAFQFAGPLEAAKAHFTYYRYVDDAFRRRGYGLMVDEIREGPTTVVARSVACFGNASMVQLDNCPADTELLSLFSR